MNDAVARGVARIGPMFEMIAADGALVLDGLGLPAGARVLDVGTGAGNFAVLLALHGFQVTTGEPADDATHYAAKDWAATAAAVGVEDRITFQHFDAGQMPFADGEFAAVFFFGVLHRVDEATRGAVFREALRVVKPGGAVTYFEPGQQTLQRVWVNDPGHPLPANPGDYAVEGTCEETKLAGRMMDIYSYRPTASRAMTA